MKILSNILQGLSSQGNVQKALSPLGPNKETTHITKNLELKFGVVWIDMLKKLLII